MHMRVDHVESEPETYEEQVQGVLGGPQASSCWVLTLFLNKASLGASHKLSLTFLSITTFMLCLIVH
jgi:hypothetical protein